MVWIENRHIDKWNRIKDSHISPGEYNYQTCDKEDKNIQ